MKPKRKPRSIWNRSFLSKAEQRRFEHLRKEHHPKKDEPSK